MAIDEKNISSEKKVEPKKSFLSRLFKWIFIFFGVLVLLLFGIFLFIQTDLFDKWSLGIFLSKMNSSLEEKDSKIYAESMTGNLLKGFTLKNGNIVVKGDTLINFSSIHADYDIWKLLDNGISLQNLIITEPNIFLTKIRDKNDSLRWNLLYLLETAEKKEEDTSDFELNWDISAENFEIQNGEVRILEEKGPDFYIKKYVMEKLDTFDIRNLDITQLYLKLGMNYFKDSKELMINDFRFKTNSDFNVKQFSLDANINTKDTITSLKSLYLITDRSDLKINELIVNGLNPFKQFIYENLKDKNVKMDLETNQFNFADLIFFLPEINFLDSTVSLNLNADGPYSNLNINKLGLKTPNSTYSFEGNVKNLNEPSELYFNIRGKNIEIDGVDTKIILPGLSIPNYSYLGKVYINTLTYVGEPERFTSDIDLRSSAGNIMGNVYFDFTQNVTRYRGDVSTINLNMGKILKDKSFESNINGDFKIDAQGFDYRTASGKLNYNLSRTKIYGQNIAKSDGQLSFNRGNVNLNITYNSDALRTKAVGKINISNLKNISYDLKGTASNLNIAAFTKDNTQKSNLNFDFDVNGRGFDPDNITGNFKISMNPSSYAEYKIPATPLDVEIDQNGIIKKVSMKSNFIDLTADGTFDVNTLSSVFNNNIEKIKSELFTKVSADSINSAASTNKSYTALCNNLNLNYYIDVKNLEPLYTFTGNDSMNFIGKLEGSISDSCGLFSFLSKDSIKQFRYKDSLLIASDAFLDINIKNDITSYGLSGFDANINFLSNKLVLNKFTLDTTQAKINFVDNKNKIEVWTKRDSTLKLFTEASVADSSVITFDSLALKYHDFLVTNNKDLIIKYNEIDSSKSIDFRQFSVNSLDQKLTITGKYSLTDSSDIKFSANNVNTGVYQKLINKDIDTSDAISGNIRYLDLTYKGTFENPDLDLQATSEELKIGSTNIGRLDAIVLYKDDDIKPDIRFSNRNNTGSFILTGNFPFLNPFIRDEIDSVQKVERLANKNVGLNATAKNFQLKVFQQMLPYTSQLEGILNGKINFVGTPEKPVLTGNMDINRGRLYVTLTKMRYNFNAQLSTQNEKLLLKNSKVFVPEEPSRFISTSGYIDFTNLTFNDINIAMTGNVKAFDKDNGSTELGVSGDLWIGSGTPSLKLSGNSSRFDLTGNLVLIKGNVVFNPFAREAYNIYSDDFTYGVIIDSTTSYNDSNKKVLMQNKDSIVVLTNLNLNPFNKLLYSDANKDLKKVAKEKSGKFFYNIYITTSENVFLKFIVNEKSQQEFFGEIKTTLYIDNKDDYEMSGRGTVYLGDNSYYKFFRKFDASGKATFNGSIVNPVLDITAVYKGYTTTQSAGDGAQNVEDVIIDLKVTGNAVNPLLTVSIQRGGIRETGSNATADAISFLLFGKFQDQLSFGESTSFGANLGASFLSNYVSSSLEEIFPFLINTNLNYIDSKTGSLAENTDIRFTAAIGDAIVRFGGQVFKGISNTDIVIDYPLNKILKLNSLSNNLILRLERVYDPFSNENDISNTSGTREGAIIYYRLKF